MTPASDDDAATLAAAIALATSQLVALEEEMRPLQAQLDQHQMKVIQLQRFIALGKHLLGESPAIPPALSGRGRRRPSAVDYATQVLETTGRPMRAQEIADYLHHQGLMPGKWTREVLRTAMRNHPQLFACVAQGLYALQAWAPASRDNGHVTEGH
jgi:hypothetical protein